MKKVLLLAAFFLGFINTHAQWAVPRPIKIINNSSVTYHYTIVHHSAFYDGVNDGIINGFNLSGLYNLWTADITGDYTVCNEVAVAPGDTHEYVETSQNGLPVGTYSVFNPNVTSLTDYALYFRTFYVKGYLQDPGIIGPGGAVRYLAPTTSTIPGLTTIPGTFGTYAYDPSTSLLYEISASHPTYIYSPPGASSGTPLPFLITFTEIGGVEYVLIS